MLAASHMNPSANKIFISCAATLLRLSPDALYNVITPTSIKATTAASRWRSICLPRKAKMRLIIFGRVVLVRGRLDFRDLAEQVVVEHFTCDRRRGGAAVTAVFHQHRERDLRCIRRGIGNEQSVITQPLVHSAFIVFLVLLHRDHLCSAGLACKLIGGPAARNCRSPSWPRHVDHGISHH